MSVHGLDKITGREPSRKVHGLCDRSGICAGTGTAHPYVRAHARTVPDDEVCSAPQYGEVGNVLLVRHSFK